MAAIRQTRLKLVVAYDGTPFRGWQSQADGNGIQDHLQAAFANICGQRIVLHGSGRTDAGVHALRQYAHCEVPRDRLPLATWRQAINAQIPREIRVLTCSRAAPDFHARYSVTGKTYNYRIWNHPIHFPLELTRSWHVHQPLDLTLLRAAADLLTGTHNFAGFAANRGAPVSDTTRTLSRIEIRKRGPLVTLAFTGDGFLYKMVRLLTGTMIRCAHGRADLDCLRRLLMEKGANKTSHAAPAHGLYLARVFYR